MSKVYAADLEMLDDEGSLGARAGFVDVKVSPDGFVHLDYEPQPLNRCTATFRLDLEQRRCWVTLFDPRVERLRFQMKRKGRPGWRSIDVTGARHFRAVLQRG